MVGSAAIKQGWSANRKHTFFFLALYSIVFAFPLISLSILMYACWFVFPSHPGSKICVKFVLEFIL